MTVEAGVLGRVELDVSCERIGFGSARIRFQTSGDGPDPNGYEVRVGEVSAYAPPNGWAYFATLPSGENAKPSG